MSPDQKKKAVILLALVGVLVLAWYSVLYGPLSGRASRLEAQSARVRLGPGEAAEESLDRPAPDEVEDLIQNAVALLGRPAATTRPGLRDPFKLTETPQVGVRQEQRLPEPDLRFVLNAIMWDQKDPIAMINGRLARAGDSVGTGITVSRIEPTCVTLSFHYWGRQNDFRLFLKPR